MAGQLARVAAIAISLVIVLWLVPAVGTTLLALAIWLVQGIGAIEWLAPSPSRLVRWVLAMWLGLVIEVVIVANAYFLVPGLTIDQLAWPVSAMLAVISIALHLRARPSSERSHEGCPPIAIAAIATLLVLRPLVAHGTLGFYFSNNGEFANYAAMADIVRYHEATTATHGLVIVSREGVIGAVVAMLCALTNKSALWIVQPVSAAFAALAFATLALLFQRVARDASRPARALIWALYACVVASGSSQLFFTLSFMSQYANIALFLGGIAFLAHARESPVWRRLLGLGLVFAALVAVYPEMLVPNVILLGAYEVIAATPSIRRDRAVLRETARAVGAVAVALVVAALLVNRLGVTLVADRAAVGSGGWNIYGAHRPVLPFLGRLVGFANMFAPPRDRSAVWPGLVAIVFVAALVHAVVRIRREPDPVLRGFYHLGWLFFLGVAAMFWVISQHHLQTNYIVLKLLLGYGWLAYLIVALALVRAIQWRPRLIVPASLVVAAMVVGLAQPALEMTKELHRAEKAALFLDDDRCTSALRGRIYFAAPPGPYAIAGRFIAFDHDVLSAEGRWPDGAMQTWLPGDSIMLLGDRRLADEPTILLPYRVSCVGRGFSVLVPADAK